MEIMIGSYLLLMELSKEKTIQIGKRGRINFPASSYVYIGSAMNGIKQRVNRHFSDVKKYHWHIDYFLNHARLHNTYYKKSNYREECKLAALFAEKFKNVPSFGSSDCNCSSHLFYGKKQELIQTITNADMKPYNKK